MKILKQLKSWYRKVYGFNYYNRDAWVAGWASKLDNGCAVLDIGAGIGKYRRFFPHCDYKAQDFGQEPGTVGNYTKLDYESDITDIPVESDSFDVALCTEVLEHVPEPALAIREIARILKPGGKLFLTAPLGSFLHQEPFHFYGGYTPHWYKRFLSEAGLDVKSIASNQGFFSLYSQETRRFHGFLSPTKTSKLNWTHRISLLTLWLLTFPFIYVLPPICYWLDSLGLENMATIGYHVVAVKRGSIA